MNIENNLVTIKSQNKEHVLKLEEYARWLCLIEAIDLIEMKAASLKQDLNSDFWIKPLSFQKYIIQRLETMILDIGREENIKVDTVVKHVAKIVQEQEKLLETA